MNETVRKVSKLVSSIRRSGPDSETLKSRVGFRLPIANDTRWNTQLLMMVTFMEALEKDPHIQEHLSAFKSHGVMNRKEIRIIKELIEILKPFAEATDEWQKDFQSVGTVIPGYLHLKYGLTAQSQPGSSIKICKAFAGSLLNSLDRRFPYVLHDTYYLMGIISMTISM